MRWQWPWQRRRPLALHSIDQLLKLARAADDPVARGEYLDLIHDQSAVLHDAAGDAAMRAVIQMDHHTVDRLKEALGPVYDLVDQGVQESRAARSHARGAEEGVAGLQGQMLTLEGRFSDLGETLNQRLDGHDAELKQLHQGQDQIKEQVGELNTRHETQIEAIKEQLADALARLEQSTQDRADLRARVEQLERERGGG